MHSLVRRFDDEQRPKVRSDNSERGKCFGIFTALVRNEDSFKHIWRCEKIIQSTGTWFLLFLLRNELESVFQIAGLKFTDEYISCSLLNVVTFVLILSTEMEWRIILKL